MRVGSYTNGTDSPIVCTDKLPHNTIGHLPFKTARYSNGTLCTVSIIDITFIDAITRSVYVVPPGESLCLKLALFVETDCKCK